MHGVPWERIRTDCLRAAEGDAAAAADFYEAFYGAEARQDAYREYLGSREWWGKRQDIIVRAKGRCERCHEANTPLEVHHMKYGKRGEEKDTDLVAICPVCHQEVHR